MCVSGSTSYRLVSPAHCLPVPPTAGVMTTSEPPPAADAAAAGGDGGSGSQYACYKCRRILFSSSTLMSHTPGQVTRSTFANKKASPLSSFSSSSAACSSVFVDPDALAVGAFADNEGKLHCPRCRSKLGSFVWSGAQCSCGEWVVPAFMFSKSRVDEKRPAAEAAAAQPNGRADHVAPVIVFKPRLEQLDGSDREEKKDSAAGNEQQPASALPLPVLQPAAAQPKSGSDLTPYR